MSNSSRPHGLQPTRLLRSWDFPGTSTGVGCHCLIQYNGIVQWHFSIHRLHIHVVGALIQPQLVKSMDAEPTDTDYT